MTRRLTDEARAAQIVARATSARLKTGDIEVLVMRDPAEPNLFKWEIRRLGVSVASDAGFALLAVVREAGMAALSEMDVNEDSEGCSKAAG